MDSEKTTQKTKKTTVEATVEAGPNQTTSGVDNKTLIILMHAAGAFFGIVPALLVYLVSENGLVKKHAKSALNFHITMLIGYVISGVLTFILIGALTGFAVWILSIVLSIVAAVKAKDNIEEVYKYPLTIELIS